MPAQPLPRAALLPALLLPAWLGCAAAPALPGATSTPRDATATASPAPAVATTPALASAPALTSAPALASAPALTSAASPSPSASPHRPASRAPDPHASPDDDRPTTAGTCVGPPSRAAQKHVQGEAMCCYTQPSYFTTRVRAKHPAFRACYDAALQRHPDLRGRVAARFVLEEDGTVTRACDAGSDLDDPEMLACVLRVFTTLTFDAYAIGDPCPAVTVTYPLVFAPDP